jgi:protein SCO1/2
MSVWVPVLLAAKLFTVDGIVVAVDPSARTMLVSHRPIGKYMPAMMMPFRVADAVELKGLSAGARVEFELVVEKEHSYARRVRKTGESDIPPAKEALRIGDRLPDFRLTDEGGRAVTPSDLRGNVVAVNFIYTRCPLPDVCPRLSANFAALHRRFGDRVLLLSVTVDPDYDTPAVLHEYARRWAADPRGWRFLTGDVAGLAAALGEVYWTDEGAIGHNSMTTVIGRDGRIAAMVEGAGYRVDQLANLVAHELEEAP